MYNKKQKNAFMNSLADPERALTLFSHTENLEVKKGKDVAEFTISEIVDFLHEYLNPASEDTLYRMKKEIASYISWCQACSIKTGYNPNDVMSIDSSDAVDAGIGRRLVSSPEHLKNLLDDVYGENRRTPSTIMCGIVWMVYMGLPVSNIFNITNDDVDLLNRVVRYDSKEYPMYQESFEVFFILKEAKTFTYIHTNPDYESERKRKESKYLLRGIRSEALKYSAMTNVSKDLRKNGYPGLTPTGVGKSGLYYRTYIASALNRPNGLTHEDIKILMRRAAEHHLPASLRAEYKAWLRHYYGCEMDK